MSGGKKDTEEKPMRKISETSTEEIENETNTEEQVFLYWN